ncbi:TPA: phospho-sugar mutase [Candidatus Avacholeplasma faecigallinarum]|nr:phospho-sugar mutase [Candidatus Avacholeplasma faecigallinarum]
MNYLEKAELWKNNKNLESNLRKELEAMDDAQLQEAFTNDLEFGTGGLRGILGAGTNRMNIYIVAKATLGFGRYLLKQSPVACAKGVAISHDNRHQSKEFARISAEVLSSLGFRVFLFEDLRPTPELSFAVRYFHCIGGIMVTASHNPKEYNGYKIYDETGCQLVPKAADKVIEEINKIDDYFNIETSKNHELIQYICKSVDEAYIKEVKKIILRPNLNKNFKLVYTPLHGTGQVFAPEVLKSVGYDVYPLACQMTNDPDFSGVKTSNPENKEAYDEAIEYAKQIGANIVLATDPDADRLGIAVLHNGEYVLFTGNQTAALILDYILKTRKELNTLPKDGYVFTTNVSSTLPIAIAKKYNMNVEITLTGFKFIGEKAHEMEAGKGTYVFGFEESYGCLISDCVRDKDSIQAILMLCETAAYYNEKGMDLIDALNEIYKEYGYYKEGITNISLQGLEGAKKIQRIMDFFRTTEIALKGFKILAKDDVKLGIKHDYVTDKSSKINLPSSNVIKYYLNDNMWFVLRPSGTEPKLKVYYGVKGTSLEDAQNRLDELSKEVLSIVNMIK